MPKIKEYNNTSNFDPGSIAGAARVQEVAGYQAGMALKQGLGEVEQGVKEVESHIASAESSKLAADLATAHAQLADEWRKTVAEADPNDTELASRFMEKRVRPTMDKLGEGLITEQAQQLHQRATASTSADLFTKTAADQAQLAGEAALTNLDTTKNQLSNLVRSDPSSLETVMPLADLTIQDLVRNHKIPQEKAEQLKRMIHGEIAKSAAYSAADSNPDQTLQDIAKGTYNKYLDGTDLVALEKYAKDRKKAAEADAKTAAIEQRRADKEAADKVATEISASTFDEKTGEERLLPDHFKKIHDYAGMPGSDDQTVRALIASAQRIQKGTSAVSSDPITRTSFMEHLWDDKDAIGRTSLSDVEMAYGQGLLSKKDRDWMRQVVNERDKDPDKVANMRMFRDQIHSLQGYFFSPLSPNPDGQRRYGEFLLDKQVEFQKGLKAGLTPRDMLDPTSKNSIFKDAQRYIPGANLERLKQAMSGNAAPIGPAPVIPWAKAPPHTGAQNKAAPNAVTSGHPQHIEGEKQDDFLKRIGR